MSTIPITLLPPVSTGSFGSASTTGLSSNFGAMVGQAIQGLEAGQTSADTTIQQALSGNASVTQAMVAMTEAQAQLDIATSIQNQAVSAYQTIMNMQLS